MQPNITSLQRVKSALEHKESDRIPFDLGSSKVTGISAVAYKKLRNYLKLPEKEQNIFDIVQQLVILDEDIINYLNIKY